MAWFDNCVQRPTFSQFQPWSLEAPQAAFLADQRDNYMDVDSLNSMETFDPSLISRFARVPLRYEVDLPEPRCVNPEDILVAQPSHSGTGPSTDSREMSSPPSPVSPQLFEFEDPPSPSTTNTTFEMTPAHADPSLSPPPIPQPSPAGDAACAIRLALGLRLLKRTALALDDDDDDGNDGSDEDGDDDGDACCNHVQVPSAQSARTKRPVAGRAPKPKSKESVHRPHCVSAYTCPDHGLCGSSGSFDPMNLTGSHHIYEPVADDYPGHKYLHQESGIWYACVGVCVKSYGRSPEAGRHTEHVPYVSKGKITTPAEWCPQCGTMFPFMRRDSLLRHTGTNKCYKAYTQLVKDGVKNPVEVEAQLDLLRSRKPRCGSKAALEREFNGPPPKKKAKTQSAPVVKAPTKRKKAPSKRKKAQRAK